MLNLFRKNSPSVEGPLLSIIIPSYNHELYIKYAIDSVLQQTYSNLELIIVDDGSKDNSVELIKSYNDERIRLICQENMGAHNAINNGLKVANGEYLAILNSDDVFEKNRFEIMIQKLQENPNVEFACSYITVIDSNGKKLGIKEGWKNMEPWPIPNPELSYVPSNEFKLNLLISNFTSTTSNFLFKRSLYEKIGGMRNLRFVHDWDFALRAAAITDCIMVEKPLMQYRIHNTNTISSNRKWMLFEILWIWATHLEKFYNQYVFPDKNHQINMVRCVESLNLQGNDKAFWIIKMFIEGQKSTGIERPEETLLDDNELRNRLLEYVVE